MNSRTHLHHALVFLLGGVSITAFAVSACVGDTGGLTADSGASDDAGATTDSGTSDKDAAASDAGGDGGDNEDAAPDAGAWTPRRLQGISLWLDSTSGVTYDGAAKATSWLDQSGNGNNATVQTPCLGPTRSANSLNNQDTLAFTDNQGVGACVTVADAPSLQFGAGDFSIFLVARYSNPPGIAQPGANTGTFWSKRLQSSPYNGVWLAGNTLSEAKLQLWQQNLSGNQVVGMTDGMNDGMFHRFGGTRRGTSFEVWIDGLSNGKTILPNADDVSQTGKSVFIGGSPELPKGWLIGNIAEVVAVKGTLSAAQIADLDAYFKNRHALP